MDHKQYTRNGVLRYEKIFGAGFISTGGIDTTIPFLKELNLKANQKVLDVGCGIGGGDFLMADVNLKKKINEIFFYKLIQRNMVLKFWEWICHQTWSELLGKELNSITIQKYFL